MSTPTGLKITDSHEWHKVEGDVVVIGITKHAVDELTDVTFVELKDAGETIGAGDEIGEVESVKATSDVYSAVGGEVAEVNQAVIDDPSLLNSDPYGDGWLVKVKAEDVSVLDGLTDSEAYDEQNG